MATEAAEAEATRVIAIRHGETAWNRERRIQGQLDLPLNGTGQWQAARMAEALSEEGISAVYASDLQRAYATAVPLAAACGVDLITDSGLRERAFGEFQGYTFDEIAARFPAQSELWRLRDPAFGPAGGEALQAFYDRCIATATRLAAAHPGETIALVAHGGVLDSFYRAAARVTLEAPRSWLVGNASINRLLYTPQGFTLIGWSDTHHLEQGALDEIADGGRATA